MTRKIEIGYGVAIDRNEVTLSFARSSGPGGQNVNKVSTRVELRFDITNSPSLSDDQRKRILQKLRTRSDKEGILLLAVQDSRSQWRNREIALEKLIEMLSGALKPTKKRIKTRVSIGAKERRLVSKKLKSVVKKNRGRVSPKNDS